MLTASCLMQQHHIVAQTGPNGYAKFEAEIRKIFGIEADMDMNLIFDCAEPTTGAWHFRHALSCLSLGRCQKFVA